MISTLAMESILIIVVVSLIANVRLFNNNCFNHRDLLLNLEFKQNKTLYATKYLERYYLQLLKQNKKRM